MTSIKDLKSDHKNARKRTDRSASLIKESLERYGAARSIVIDEDNRILAGNGTIEGAKAAGIENLRVIETDGTEIIAVKRTGLSEEEKVGLALADNRTSDLSDWDANMLKQLSEEQDITPWFDDEDLAEIIGEVEQLPAEGLTDADDVPETLEEPTTKPGDLWVLGNHRLLCGDSTNPQHVDKLMDGKKADMVFTDPPYGIGGYAGRSGKFAAIKNDNLEGAELANLIACIPEATHRFIWTTWSTYHTFVEALGVPDALIVWVKPWPGMGRGYRGKHEFCMFYGECDSTDLYNVWENGYELEGVKSTWDRTAKCNLHPTQKPVALAEFAIANHKPRSVLDLFGGSGSTLIACEKTSRHCRMMELDPAYCDVIVKRWEDFTGNTAVCEPSEAHFEQEESF